MTVLSFTLASDTNVPRIEVPFHLIVTLRVRERVSQIANINLPMLAQLELLGDERETVTGPRGTQYRETITVVAHQAGGIAIAPATLQAIDARDGKPKEWYTNGLTLHVGGAAPHVLRDALQLVRAIALALFWVLLWLVGIGCIVLAAVLFFGRRRRPAVATYAPPPAPPPTPIIERSRREQAEDALAVLRTERSRPAAVAVRSAIWRMVGASDGETLGDVLRRPESHDEIMRQLLIALERSAFTYDDDLPRAIDDACSALERYIGAAA
ncbi:MAG: hypothetical protein WA431_02230 [Candidatus Cybelea sp.]